MNLLFICEKNVMRSRTAEAIYSADGRHNAKSAGILRGAKVMVTAELIRWSDIIFVMEDEQKYSILEDFPGEIGHREIVVLDIHDYYYFMEPELVELIKIRVSPHLEG
jgi:protein-tyrosine phosphatase